MDKAYQIRKKNQEIVEVPAGVREDGSVQPYSCSTQNFKGNVKDIRRVWAIFPEFKHGDNPVHHGNAFLEDIGHDWILLNNNKVFNYMGVVAKHGGRILIEYKP